MKNKIKAKLNKLKPVIQTYGPPAIYGAIGAATSIAYLTHMGQRELFAVDKYLLRDVGDGLKSVLYATEKYGDLILTKMPTPKQ